MAAAVKLDTQQVYQPSQLAQTVWDESRERQSGGWRSRAGAIPAALAHFFQPSRDLLQTHSNFRCWKKPSAKPATKDIAGKCRYVSRNVPAPPIWEDRIPQETRVVISLKKYLDMEPEKPAPGAPDPREMFSVALGSYRSALLAMGANGTKACPPVGAELQQCLAELEGGLAASVTPELIRETEKKVEEHLERWGGRSTDYLKEKTNDAKELLLALARTAQSVGERDKRYTSQFNEFTSRLQTIANLEDLTQVRSSLVQEASKLKTYVDRMNQDGQSLVKQLQTDVSSYETKLKAAEELVLRDELTGLSNRRNVEERIHSRIAKGEPFCVVILDLNKFKQVNDTHGHLAGDALLKQFAGELRSSSRSVDTVGRWGGDEFIMVLECDLAGATLQLDRTKRWTFGEYKIQLGEGAPEIKVDASASIGLAQWQPGESMKDVIEHADKDMYVNKGQTRNEKR
jgi:diguanylate cyclase (GGDEF)-like protein